jgi:hypothetical protein
MKKVKETVLFSVFVTEEDIEREKSKAREIRRSRWWHQKCAQGVCFYCGSRVGSSNLTMDHVVPLIRGVEVLRTTWCRPARNAIITRNICCPWSGRNISIHAGHRGFRESKKYDRLGFKVVLVSMIGSLGPFLMDQGQ